MQKDITVLDCTLRDGGYYNNWHFSDNLTNRYLSAMRKSGVNYVELGFRTTSSDSSLGPYAFTPDKWINRLDIPEGLSIGVMCNAKDLICPDDELKIVKELFTSAENSPVSLVRIAAHFAEVEACAPIIKELKKLGYTTGFNLMQSSGRTKDELVAKAELAASWPLDVLYFADSLGNMKPEDIHFIVDALRVKWKGPMGFHAHDNMGMGLINALAAINEGVTWIDATVTGMGRGAGNVKLEYLLLELVNKDQSRLDLLMDLVIEDFEPMQKKCGWGPSLFYHLSAYYNVHPTYVQEMLSDERYDPSVIVHALQKLGEAGASGFSRDHLKEVTESEPLICQGSWSADKWVEDRDVLILAAGESLKTYSGIIDFFIEKKNPFVISINDNPWISRQVIDAWAACNPDRILVEQGFYESSQGVLLAPRALFTRESIDLGGWDVLDYGVQVEQDIFNPSENSATIPAALSAMYVLAAVKQGGARSVYLAGFDGYTNDDVRHIRMEDALEIYSKSADSLPISSITPTSLSIKETTVFEI